MNYLQYLIFSIIVLAAIGIVQAGQSEIGTTPVSGDTVDCSPLLVTYTTVYPDFSPCMTQLDGDDGGEDPFMAIRPANYEYAYTGDTIHFWAKISDITLGYVETDRVFVVLDNGVEQREAELLAATGTFPSYNPATGRYEYEFEGDLVVTEDMGGLYFLSIKVDGQNCAYANDLTSSIYEPVNDLLLNPEVVMSYPDGIHFTLKVNQYNKADIYPVELAINTQDDREGQGVVGCLGVAATDLKGVSTPSDVIPSQNMRMRTDNNVQWTSMLSNYPEIQYIYLSQMAVTDFDGIFEQLYFELWFDSSHVDREFDDSSILISYFVY